MAFRWPPKDPDEVLDYSVDWSRFLDDATISSVLWFCDDENGEKTAFDATDIVNNLQNIQQTSTDTVATIRLGLGTNNETYKIYCRIQDSEGLSAERAITVTIREN